MGGLLVDILGIPLTMALGILVTPLFFRYINIDDYGYWITVLDFMTFLNILNAGIGFYIVQTIANEKTVGMETTRKSLSSVALVQLFIIFLMLLTCSFVYWTLPSFQDPSNKFQDSHWIFAIMTVNLLANSIWLWLTNILYAQNRISLSNGLGLGQKTFTQLFPLILLASGIGLISFSISYLSISAILIIISVFFTFHYLKLRLSWKSVRSKDLQEVSLFSFRYMLGNTSFYILHFTDTLIIANFISTASVTIYVLTMKLANVGKFFPARIVALAFPSIAQLIQEKSYDRLHEVTIKLFKVGLRIGLFSCGVIIFLNPIFVPHWVGEDKFGGYILSYLSAILCLREAITPVFFHIIYSTKEIKTFNYILFFEALANILLSIILLNFWSINGVVIASIISSSFLSVGYSWYKACKIIHISKVFFLPSLITTITKFIPTFVILWAGMVLLKSNFSWFLFTVVIIAAGVTNSICFEGRTIIKYRKLSFKEIVIKLINEA